MYQVTDNHLWESPLLPARFWGKVLMAYSGCWVWTGRLTNGYGRFQQEGQVVYAHRLAYEALVGAIPAGLHVDHLCRVRRCVNPHHLEPVTIRVNTLRGIGPAAVNVTKTQCDGGHEFTPENTYTRIRGERILRTCRMCARLRRRRYRGSALPH